MSKSKECKSTRQRKARTPSKNRHSRSKADGHELIASNDAAVPNTPMADMPPGLDDEAAKRWSLLRDEQRCHVWRFRALLKRADELMVYLRISRKLIDDGAYEIDNDADVGSVIDIRLTAERARPEIEAAEAASRHRLFVDDFDAR